MAEIYSVWYHCSNCLKSVLLDFVKGNLAPKTAECPNCGCNTLVKEK